MPRGRQQFVLISRCLTSFHVDRHTFILAYILVLQNHLSLHFSFTK